MLVGDALAPLVELALGLALTSLRPHPRQQNEQRENHDAATTMAMISPVDMTLPSLPSLGSASRVPGR